MIDPQFVVAVSSSLTTAALLWLVRQVVKIRQSASKLANEHRFLMASMHLVLAHLGLEAIAKEYQGKL